MNKHMLLKIFAVVFSVLILTNSIIAYGLERETDDVAKYSWESKIQPYLLEKMQDTDEKIPVWLWMEDIDQEEAEQEVYERTGLNEANLSVIAEPLPVDLAESVAELSEADEATRLDVKSQFQEYLDRTEEARELEAQRVDTYIGELRDVQNEMYCEKNASVFSSFKIPQEDVIFTETQAPVYIVKLNKNDIQRLAKNSKVTAIYYCDTDTDDITDDDSLSDSVNASTVSRIRSEIGLTGRGVKIGIIDSHGVQYCDEIAESRITYIEPSVGNGDVHGTNVARISAGSSGVAPAASIYSTVSAKKEEIPAPILAITSLSSNGVCVANYSMGHERTDKDGDYSPQEIYIDFMVRSKRFLLVKTAGNKHGAVNSPGLAYNVITVGGYFNKGTTNYEDDTMYYNSSYNSLSGCFKPDLVAVQPKIDGRTGTSYAAPFVTGTVALLYELRPTLQTQPEAVKAILMGSCHRKANPSDGDPVENITSGLTDHQGAGAIDPYMAIAIAGSGNYGIRTMDSNVNQELIRFQQPAYGSSGLNVSLAWSVENPNGTTVGSKINLDLSLLRNNTQIKTSTQSTSSTEMVYVAPSSTQKDYTIKIDRRSSTGTAVRYAYAFSVDRNRYQHTNISQGIFYLRNRATGQYLTLANGDVHQTAFSGGTAQQWLLNSGKIYAVSTDSGKLAIGGPINGNYNYRRAVINSSSGAVVQIDMNGIINGNYYDRDGTFTFFNSDSESALSIYNNSNASGATAAWVPYSSSDKYQQWYLESAAYQRGDVNMDGVINTTDQQMISQYILGKITFSDVQKYLADVDGDGRIMLSDASHVGKISEGLE